RRFSEKREFLDVLLLWCLALQKIRFQSVCSSRKLVQVLHLKMPSTKNNCADINSRRIL
ncbi:unnamed protein product, partial [Cylicocyclus nassatus]